MRLVLLILLVLSSYISFSQTYTRDGKGIKYIQLEGCKVAANGQPCDSCFVMTWGVNGKLNKCLHISELRNIIQSGTAMDSVYLVNNNDGTYTLINENNTEYDFGYEFLQNADTLFLTDIAGHKVDTVIFSGITGMAKIDTFRILNDTLEISLLNDGEKRKQVLLHDYKQTLSWDSSTGDLGISFGNTVNLDGRYQLIGSGNGIYGGSDTVNNNTLAHLSIDSVFALGEFPSFPSTNASDRGVYWYAQNGVRIYGGNSGDGSSNTIAATPSGIDLRSQIGLNSSRIRLSQTLGEYFFNNNKYDVDNDSLYLMGGNEYHNVNALGISIGGDRGADSTVLTSVGGYAYWLPAQSGGGGGGATIDSVMLNLSGNVMTSKVNTTSDTSLVIGSHTIVLGGQTLYSQTNGVIDTADLSSLLTTGTTNVITENGNVLTSTVNGVTDTTLSIRTNTASLSGNSITSSVNGVSDTVLVIGQHTISYTGSILTSTTNGVSDTALIVAGGLISDVDLDLSGNVMTSDVDGVSDTSVVIGTHTVNLSGNQITSNTNGVTDTTLVIGNVTTNLSGTILTTSVNGVSDTAQLSSLVAAATTNDLSSSANTMTSTVNGVTDNAVIVNTLTHGSSGNDITVAVNGLPASTTIINTNRLVLGNDSLKTQINGIVSNAVPLDSILLNGITNQISLSGNTITSNVNTITDTCLAIGQNTLSYDSGSSIVTSTINGVTDTAYLGNFNVIQYVDTIKTRIDANAGLFSTGWSLYQDSKAPTYISWDSLGYWNVKSGSIITTHANFPIGVMPYTNTGMNSAKLRLNDSTTSDVHMFHFNNKRTGNLITDYTVNNTHFIDTITQAYRSITAGSLSSLQRGLVMDTMGMIGIGITTAQPQYELDVTGSTRLNGHIYDISNSNGNNGEVLTRTTTGVDWQPVSAPVASVITPSMITSNEDNYNPTGFDGATIVRVSGDNGIWGISSLAAQSDGEEKTFINVGTYPLYFAPEHPDGTAANRISYYEDLILMPKKSIKMAYDTILDRWIVTTDVNIDGCSKVIDYQVNAGSITNGDIDFWSPNGASATFATGVASATFPASYVNIGTSTSASAAGVMGLSKTSATSYQSLSYLGSSHLSVSSMVAIPTLSDATDSFTVFMVYASGATDAFINNSFGIAYSHGMYGGNWTGYTRDGTTTNKVDLGINVAANKMYNLRAEYDKSRTEVRFYIDGVFKGRSTANVPGAIAVAASTGIKKGVGTTARNVYVMQMNTRSITP